MTPEQVFDHYGGRSATAKRFGISYQAVKEWADNGCVPELRQHQIQLDTGGALTVDARLLPAPTNLPSAVEGNAA